MFQLTRSGPAGAASTERARMAEEFARQHCLRLPQFLEPGLLDLIRAHIRRASFQPYSHRGIGTEECMAPCAASGLLHFLANGPVLFQFVEEVTACGRVGCFQGRVYRMRPNAGHYDSWHNDLGEHRLIGLSVNLSEEEFSGGVFQLRERSSGRILCEIANTGPGDAILFRLADPLQHRVTPVEGSAAKTALAGWFRSQPETDPLLRRKS